MTAEEREGMLGTIESLGGKVIGSLPAQFLLLVVLNTIFIVGLLWFLSQQNAARERVLGPVLSQCMNSVPLEALRHMQGAKP